jgi:RimJ/RimL family protein N-acetyltransferase
VSDDSVTIRTARLDLRPLQPVDAAEMVAVLGDPSLYAFIGGEPPTRDALRNRYERLTAGRSADGREEWRDWIVRTRADGRAIGTVQATIVDHGKQAAIAWVIGVPWQGHGFATDAATALVAWLVARGVSSISATIHPDHDASATVARRVGFEPTEEMLDGERVWQLAQPKRHPESLAATDESR